MEDVHDNEVLLLHDLVYALDHLGQLGPGYHRVVQVVVGFDHRNGPEGTLSSLPDSFPLPLVGRNTHRPCSMGAGQLPDTPDLVGHAGRLPVEFHDEHSGGVGRISGVHEWLDGLHHPLVHHLEGGRDHSSGDDGADGLGGRAHAHEVQ